MSFTKEETHQPIFPSVLSVHVTFPDVLWDFHVSEGKDPWLIPILWIGHGFQMNEYGYENDFNLWETLSNQSLHWKMQSPVCPQYQNDNVSHIKKSTIEKKANKKRKKLGWTNVDDILNCVRVLLPWQIWAHCGMYLTIKVNKICFYLP